jgi:hypothetical protein
MSEPADTDENTGRVRVIFDTEELIRQAIAMRVFRESLRARRPVSKSEVLTAVLREALADEVQQLQSAPPDPGPAKKRGRKPKEGGGK